MQLLPRWVLPPTLPSVYESESATALEMVAKVYGAMNELIKEYNVFADSVNEQYNAFTEEEREAREKLQLDVAKIVRHLQSCMDQRLKELETDVLSTTKTIINDAIKNGTLVITETYDPETESLNLAVTEEV